MYSQDSLERFLLLVSAILRQWEMTPVSVAYHFIVSTCNLQEHLILKYLKNFFTEIVTGNRDYRTFVTSTIIKSIGLAVLPVG